MSSLFACVWLLVWACACHVAFEATRFYNVSESSPLARELCDGPTCNEVESSTNQWIGEIYSLHFHQSRSLVFASLSTLLVFLGSNNQTFFAGFVQGNQCNNVFGCLEEEQFERCTCYRDCGYDGEPVCGSDGQLYQNQCQMEVFACRNGTRIEQVPLSQCPQSKSSFCPTHHLTSHLALSFQAPALLSTSSFFPPRWQAGSKDGHLFAHPFNT